MNLSFEDSEEGYSMKKYINAFLSLIMTISGAAICFAEETAVGVMANGGKSISQPLKWGQAAPNAVEKSPDKNKFILTDGENGTKELTLLDGQDGKAFVLAPIPVRWLFMTIHLHSFKLSMSMTQRACFIK